MRMYDWRSFVTNRVQRTIAMSAGVARLAAVDVDLIREILSRSGGWAVFPSAQSEPQRSAVAFKLLQQCATVALRNAGVSEPNLALRMAAVRGRWYGSLASLDFGAVQAVSMDGRSKSRKKLPGNPRRRTASRLRGELDSDLSELIALQAGRRPQGRLRLALYSMANAVNADGLEDIGCRFAKKADLGRSWLTTRAVGVVAGKEYYSVAQRLIGLARRQIDVCMFHVAFPKPDHPTGLLIRALVAAIKRKCTVRVLLDRDRENDPYKSTVINSNAARVLAGGGVQVRIDKAEILMHSKYMIVDGHMVLLGSHNWSAGSYFTMDDVSVLCESLELARSLQRRFQEQWKGGHPAGSA